MSYHESIRESLLRAMQDGSWREYSGRNCRMASEMIAASLQRRHVRLCCSGTMAVELAIRSLHLAPTDEVVLATYDYPGNFRAIEDAGCQIALCDVEPRSWQIDWEQLQSTIGPNTKAILVSHLHGTLVPMRRIMQWAGQRGLRVIEDACQVHGAIVDGQPVGSWGDVATLSFGGSKLISAGRGGAVLTNDDRTAQRMTIFAERGNDAFAMSELQASVIIPQWSNLAELHAARMQSVLHILGSLRNYDWIHLPSQPIEANTNEPAYYKLGFMVSTELTRAQRFVQNATLDQPEQLTPLRDNIAAALVELGVNVGAGFRGFSSRSARRCRPSARSHGGKIAASSTLLIHHEQLLDPFGTETNIPDKVIRAFDHLNDQRNHAPH